MQCVCCGVCQVYNSVVLRCVVCFCVLLFVCSELLTFCIFYVQMSFTIFKIIDIVGEIHMWIWHHRSRLQSTTARTAAGLEALIF